MRGCIAPIWYPHRPPLSYQDKCRCVSEGIRLCVREGMKGCVVHYLRHQHRCRCVSEGIRLSVRGRVVYYLRHQHLTHIPHVITHIWPISVVRPTC